MKGIYYMRYMDDFLILSGSRRTWEYLYRFFDFNGFTAHSEKTLTGKTEKGLTGWRAVTSRGIEGIAPRALENHRCRCMRLEEQARKRGLSEEAVAERGQRHEQWWKIWGGRNAPMGLMRGAMWALLFQMGDVSFARAGAPVQLDNRSGLLHIGAVHSAINSYSHRGGTAEVWGTVVVAPSLGGFYADVRLPPDLSFIIQTVNLTDRSKVWRGGRVKVGDRVKVGFVGPAGEVQVQFLSPSATTVHAEFTRVHPSGSDPGRMITNGSSPVTVRLMVGVQLDGSTTKYGYYYTTDIGGLGGPWVVDEIGVSTTVVVLNCPRQIMGNWSDCAPLPMTYANGGSVTLAARLPVSPANGCEVRAGGIQLTDSPLPIETPPRTSYMEEITTDVKLGVKCLSPGAHRIPVLFERKYK